NLCVSAAADGFDERLIARIRRMSGVRAAAPVVEVNALVGRLSAGDRDAGVELGGRRGFDETLLVLGLDPFSEPPFGRLAAGSTAATCAWPPPSASACAPRSRRRCPRTLAPSARARARGRSRTW